MGEGENGEWEKIEASSVRVGVHQGSVLSLLLFIIMLKALSREFGEGLLMKLHAILKVRVMEEGMGIGGLAWAP